MRGFGLNIIKKEVNRMLNIPLLILVCAVSSTIIIAIGLPNWAQYFLLVALMITTIQLEGEKRKFEIVWQDFYKNKKQARDEHGRFIKKQT